MARLHTSLMWSPRKTRVQQLAPSAVWPHTGGKGFLSGDTQGVSLSGRVVIREISRSCRKAYNFPRMKHEALCAVGIFIGACRSQARALPVRRVICWGA